MIFSSPICIVLWENMLYKVYYLEKNLIKKKYIYPCLYLDFANQNVDKKCWLNALLLILMVFQDKKMGPKKNTFYFERKKYFLFFYFDRLINLKLDLYIYIYWAG